VFDVVNKFTTIFCEKFLHSFDTFCDMFCALIDGKKMVLHLPNGCTITHCTTCNFAIYKNLTLKQKSTKRVAWYLMVAFSFHSGRSSRGAGFQILPPLVFENKKSTEISLDT